MAGLGGFPTGTEMMARDNLPLWSDNEQQRQSQDGEAAAEHQKGKVIKFGVVVMLLACVVVGLIQLLNSKEKMEVTTPEAFEFGPKFLEGIDVDSKTLADAESIKAKMIHRLWLSKDRDTSFEVARKMHQYLAGVDPTQGYLTAMYEAMADKLKRNLVTACLSKNTYQNLDETASGVAKACLDLGVMDKMSPLHSVTKKKSGFAGLAFDHDTGDGVGELHISYRGTKDPKNFLADVAIAGLEARWSEQGDFNGDWNHFAMNTIVQYLDRDEVFEGSVYKDMVDAYYEGKSRDTMWYRTQVAFQNMLGWGWVSEVPGTMVQFSNMFFEENLIEHMVDAEEFTNEAIAAYKSRHGDDSKPKIVFSGHSLGGCFAQVLGFVTLVTESANDPDRLNDVRVETYNAPGCLLTMIGAAEKGKGKLSEPFRSAITVHPAFSLVRGDQMSQSVLDAFVRHRSEEHYQYTWPRIRDAMERNFAHVYHPQDGVTLGGVHVCPTCLVAVDVDEDITKRLIDGGQSEGAENWGDLIGLEDFGKALDEVSLTDRVILYHHIEAFAGQFAKYGALTQDDVFPSSVDLTQTVSLADVAQAMAVSTETCSIMLKDRVDDYDLEVGFRIERNRAVQGLGVECHAGGTSSSEAVNRLEYAPGGQEECEMACYGCESCAGFVDNKQASPPYCVFKSNVEAKSKRKGKDLYVRPKQLTPTQEEQDLLRSIDETWECLQANVQSCHEDQVSSGVMAAIESGAEWCKNVAKAVLPLQIFGWF